MIADLCRLLRDIRDGHVNLWVRVARFDTSTGAEVEPTEVETSPDRRPAAAAGNGVHWWRSRWPIRVGSGCRCCTRTRRGSSPTRHWMRSPSRSLSADVREALPGPA